MPDGTLNKRYVRPQTLAPDPVDVFALGQIREQFTCGRIRRKPGDGAQRGSAYTSSLPRFQRHDE